MAAKQQRLSPSSLNVLVILVVLAVIDSKVSDNSVDFGRNMALHGVERSDRPGSGSHWVVWKRTVRQITSVDACWGLQEVALQSGIVGT